MRIGLLTALLAPLILACSPGSKQKEQSESTTVDPEIVESELAKSIAIVGDYEIFSVQLRENELPVSGMFVGADPESVKTAEKELPEGWIKKGNVYLRNQAFVVKGPDILMMVGTSVGDGNRDKNPLFMQNLAAINVSTSEVNYVFSTHFHGDHIGWHTRRLEMNLMPTFPNAKYLMITKEYE